MRVRSAYPDPPSWQPAAARYSRMRSILGLALLASLVACANKPKDGHANAYQLVGIEGRVDGATAERLHRDASNKLLRQEFADDHDRPVQLLWAPQPVMSPAGLIGREKGVVVVDILFSHTGAVERIDVVESTGESFSRTVRAAVRQWRIAPATKAGKPVGVRARQEFEFRSSR